LEFVIPSSAVQKVVFLLLNGLCNFSPNGRRYTLTILDWRGIRRLWLEDLTNREEEIIC